MSLIIAQHLYSTLLKITFPDEKYLFKEITFDKIRYAGWTLPGSTLTVHGKQIKIYPSGAFVGIINLNPGENIIEFRSETSSGVASEILKIRRTKPLITSPEFPLIIDEHMRLPDKDIALSAGDVLEVKFKGSPNANAFFEIPGVLRQIPMVEVTEDGVKGIYVGHYVVQPDDKVYRQPVKYVLKRDGKSVKAFSPGKVSLLPQKAYKVACVVEELAPMFEDIKVSRPSPHLIPQGTKLVITGEYDRYYRIKFSRNKSFWIEKSFVNILPEGSPPPKANIYSITVSSQPINNRTRISFGIDEHVPYIVNEKLYPPSVELILSGVKVDTGWITQYVSESSHIKGVQFAFIEDDVLKFTVYLADERHYGYNVYCASKRLTLEIKHKPVLKPTTKKPLNGLNVFIDPGHGGEHDGAIGPTGLKEKDVCLDISLKLLAYLEKAGANVGMSRLTDTTLTWKERFQLAREFKPDIYLCVHNNSVPETIDPTLWYGASTFYNYLSGKHLSEIITRELSEIGLAPHLPLPYYVYRHPYVYLLTDTIFVLIEAGFISHPEDEMKLMDDAFKDKIAYAIFNSLLKFLK